MPILIFGDLFFKYLKHIILQWNEMKYYFDIFKWASTYYCSSMLPK